MIEGTTVDGAKRPVRAVGTFPSSQRRGAFPRTTDVLARWPPLLQTT